VVPDSNRIQSFVAINMFKATVKNSFLVFASAEKVAHRARSLTADFPALEHHGSCGDDNLELQLARLNSLMNQSIQSSVVCDTEELYGKWWCDAMCDMQGAGFQCGLSSQKSSIPRIDSNSSVSTMVPDDTCSFGGLKQVASSSSVSSLSDLDQEVLCSAENDQLTSLHEGSDSKLNKNSGKTQIGAFASRPGQDFSHCHVPRHVNLAKDFAAGAFQSTHPTTIMIRNIPNHYSQHQIMKELEVLGFAGTFDFFYAPMDRSTKCTVGYAFVNFLDHKVAEKCIRTLQNHWFVSHGRQRVKQARVSIHTFKVWKQISGIIKMLPFVMVMARVRVAPLSCQVSQTLWVQCCMVVKIPFLSFSLIYA